MNVELVDIEPIEAFARSRPNQEPENIGNVSHIARTLQSKRTKTSRCSSSRVETHLSQFGTIWTRDLRLNHADENERICIRTGLIRACIGPKHGLFV